ncbi:MAG: hypothetical protein HY288_01560 [Planctomycetia bacterium]|nr:hypothetical protein [Planctomycetia bacterium]
MNAAVQIRSTFNSTTGVPNAPGAGNTAANSLAGNFFAVNNARLLFSGQVHEVIGFELNTEMSNAQIVDNTTLSFPTSINLLDAIVKYSGDDLFNIWAGQFLPPSDRSLLDGPFFINAWDFPFTSNYPNVFQGREIGAAYWGQLNGGMLQWSAGVFNGSGRTLASPSTNGFLPSPPPGPPNPNGRPLQFAARVTLDLLDPEPGYYKQSTYYGQKDILAIGFAIQTQARSVGTAAGSSNFTGLNADILFEKKLDNDGVFTAEGAFYNYDNAGLATSSQQGESGFIYTGYLMPRIFGFGAVEGRFRPYARYQQYNHDFLAPSAGLFSRGTDVGTDYIINGHNARLTAFWGDREVIGTGHINLFRIGAQVVF